ncbi:uncharacterized protein N7459_008810 [Penicillium hispanicum]|uniref:uncharacterized protein n=1 Tax=Penicillium hispanicum TaxID=1080232 RepID=UPI0025400B7F|nr:uncharacterized protein N7459_008810 [Penicillium hispanicum]KAJ5574383.1 hypothetical protein N7459_008810 [Penicillium hispanicum]
MGQSGTSKRPKIRWDCVKRQVLCCLYRFFVCDEGAFEQIFCEMFRDDLVKCGFGLDNPSYRVLHAQWTWLKRSGSPVWIHVHRETEFRPDADWSSIINSIEAMAWQLGISLVSKDKDDIDTSDLNNVNIDERFEEFLESVLISNHSSPEAVDMSPAHESTLAPPSFADKQPFDQSECLVTSYGKVCIWCQQDGTPPPTQTILPEAMLTQQYPTGQALLTSLENMPGFCHHEELPLVLYRWSNFSSQGVNSRSIFLAGQFASTEARFMRPEQLHVSEFLKHFCSHVRKEKVPTPFISAFTLPLAPVHRSLHSPEGAMVSVIDTGKLDTPVYKAQSLVPLTGTATMGWRGYGEFLIWGRVPTPAIVATFTIASLKEVAAANDDIHRFLQLPLIESNFRCNPKLHNELKRRISSIEVHGQTLKRLAESLGVPEPYRDIVARGFWESWTKKLPDQPQFSAADNTETQITLNDARLLQPTQTLRAGSDTPEYLPPPPTNDGSRETSVEENSRGSDESSEARCPRHDTPDEGCFSVHDGSTTCSEGWRRHAPLTTPSSGQHDRVLAWAQMTPIPIGIPLQQTNTQNQSNEDDTEMGDDWPTDDEGLIDTPTQPRVVIPALDNQLARRAYFKKFELGSQ